MKRFVPYQLDFKSRWLTLSGVMMGFAFFLQALDYFALGQFFQADTWNLVLYLILPMFMEFLWCIPLRMEKWARADIYGIFAALICLILLGQTVLSGGIFQIVMASVFLALAATTAVLVTWGFVAHRALGVLVFGGVVAMQVLVFLLPGFAAAPGYVSLIRLIPCVCMTLSIVFLFGGIRTNDTVEP